MKLRLLLTKYEDRLKQYQVTQLNNQHRAMTEKPPEKLEYPSYAPYNFSWLVENKIAGMGWPQSVENLNYLVDVGVTHLVTLSPERVPPILELPAERRLKWTEIPVKEFAAPTLKQILQFVAICERAKLRGEVVGVHCRQGRGRTGTMLAAYLVYAHDMAPERAVLTVRVQRPGSCETYQQEKAVCHYHDCLRGSTDTIDYLLVDSKDYFDRNVREGQAEPGELPATIEQDQPETRPDMKPERKPKTKAMVINHRIYF